MPTERIRPAVSKEFRQWPSTTPSS
jgi:hypothetical protein